MICEKCSFNGDFIEEQFGDGKLIFCPECYFLKTDYCKHEKNSKIKYQVNGNSRVQNMCEECFKLHGQFIKQSELDLSKIQTIDKDKYDKYQEEQSGKYRKRYLEISERNSKWNKSQFFEEHNKYLKTIQWLEKRDEVLKRDNYLCQACLKSRATQVHHLNYNHWKHEPLFELVSVCAECHEEITRIDQANKIR